MSIDISDIETIFSDSAGKISDSTTRDRLSTAFGDLKEKYIAADASNAGEREEIERGVLRLVGIAQAVAWSSKNPWRKFSITAIYLTILAFFLFIFLYFYGLGAERYASIESTRPILVFTLIICMLGFGGLLIVRPLYSPEPAEQFQQRFRLSREVFLVFSGIFGTIIGFYFGAGDNKQSQAPSLEIGYTNQMVTATVSDGVEPFIGILTPKGETGGSSMKVDRRVLSYKAAKCPDGATVVVIDGQGRRSEKTVSCARPEAPAPADNATGNVANPAPGNLSAGNVT